LLRATAVAVVVTLSATLGNGLLWRLSQFGPQPFPTLPTAVPVLFGLLFSGALVDAVGRLGRPAALAPLAAGVLGAAALVLLAPAVPARYLLAPAAAATVAGALHTALPRRAGMLAAMTVYVACTLLANYTLDSFLPVGGLLLVNVGTLFFGITFTQRDRVHGFGRRAVYTMIVAAACANVALASALGTPLRYVAVSFLSIVLSETADTEVYQRLLDRPWLVRVMSSNAVSAPLDTLAFTLLAFVGQAFATPQWLLRVIATDIVVKYGSSLLAAAGRLGADAGGARAALGPGAEAS
jgi:hypothetical protein